MKHFDSDLNHNVQDLFKIKKTMKHITHCPQNHSITNNLRVRNTVDFD